MVFQIGNRCFIVMDTQVYVLSDEEALRMREKQSDWLIKTFASLPAGMKTTIFTHTPLFIESVDESKAVEGKVSFLPQQFNVALTDTVTKVISRCQLTNECICWIYFLKMASILFSLAMFTLKVYRQMNTREFISIC